MSAKLPLFTERYMKTTVQGLQVCGRIGLHAQLPPQDPPPTLPPVDPSVPIRISMRKLGLGSTPDPVPAAVNSLSNAREHTRASTHAHSTHTPHSFSAKILRSEREGSSRKSCSGGKEMRNAKQRAYSGASGRKAAIHPTGPSAITTTKESGFRRTNSRRNMRLVAAAGIELCYQLVPTFVGTNLVPGNLSPSELAARCGWAVERGPR